MCKWLQFICNYHILYQYLIFYILIHIIYLVIIVNLRTDLAVEDIKSGTKKQFKDFVISKVIVDNYNENKYKKNKGIYYTLDTKVFKNGDHDKEAVISSALSRILKNIFNELDITSKDEIFIVGLGNDDITPDSLGPLVVDNIIVTKHLYNLDMLGENMGVVSALKPGVMGQTGIETSDIIKSVVKSVKPKCLIVIDALASRSLKRVGCSIQISTGGISPGSGVRNKRKEISFKTIGVPVIAIGVPTVVDVKNIGNDILEFLKIESDTFDILEDSELDFMLTPKEIDKYMIDLSNCIADAINNTIHNL